MVDWFDSVMVYVFIAVATLSLLKSTKGGMSSSFRDGGVLVVLIIDCQCWVKQNWN